MAHKFLNHFTRLLRGNELTDNLFLYWPKLLWGKRLWKVHFSSIYPPLAFTTASKPSNVFLLHARTMSASMSSHALMRLRLRLSKFLWKTYPCGQSCNSIHGRNFETNCQSRHFDQFSHRSQWLSVAFSHHKGHFTSVRKCPFLEHHHGDILEYCGGCFRATDLLIGQILSYIPSYQLFIIKITIFNT